MSVLAAKKSTARTAAFVRRKLAHAKLGPTPPNFLAEVLRPHAGKILAAYMPIRTEISPMPEMLAHAGLVTVPVIQEAGRPLKFARWQANAPMARGPFGAQVPENIDYLTPEVLIVPLVAFDDAGNRLGYGGGFYDRSLEGLRARGPVVAIGFAYENQLAVNLPLEATDQPLDFIVTDTKIRAF